LASGQSAPSIGKAARSGYLPMQNLARRNDRSAPGREADHAIRVVDGGIWPDAELSGRATSLHPRRTGHARRVKRTAAQPSAPVEGCRARHDTNRFWANSRPPRTHGLIRRRAGSLVYLAIGRKVVGAGMAERQDITLEQMSPQEQRTGAGVACARWEASKPAR